MDNRSTIYFDNNATTHIDPVVAERLHELNLAGISNPASQHRPGRRALHLLEEAKSEILELVGAPNHGMSSARLILTSGGTEANNLAVFGLLARRPGTVIVGATDHPSIIEAARAACRHDELRILPVDGHGLCDLDCLQSWLSEIYAAGRSVSFVSIMLGNNETGVIQDMKKISQICRAFGVPVHSDIVQAVGKIETSMTELGLSAATLTAHKIHGPVGIGALVLDHQLSIDPMIIGGGQQLGLRAGTEPVIPAVGLATALSEICKARLAGVYDRLRELRDSFEVRLTEACDAVIVAGDAPRLPHTSNLSFPGRDRQALHMALDLNGLACSTGSACSSGSGRPSGSLVAMQLPDDVVRSALRFSFSRFSTSEEVDSAIKIVCRAAEKCGLIT